MKADREFPGGQQKPMTEEEREYIALKRALYRKIVDCLDGCGLTVASAANVLRDVTNQIFICQKNEPVESVIGEIKNSRFYQDS